MKKQFCELKLGEPFCCQIEGEKMYFIKTSEKEYDGPLSSRPPNAVNCNNKHECVFGKFVPVEVKDENS